MARSILVIHPGALGDLLLAVPALREIKAKLPDHRILLMSNEPVGRLLLECRFIDAWMSVQGAVCAALCSGSVPDSIEVKQWLGACDLAVVWMKDDDRSLATALKSCGVGEILIQSPFSSQLKSRHQSDRFLETLGATAHERPVGEPLQLSTSMDEQGRALLVDMGISSDRPLALIHPGSGSRHKCASVEKFANIVVALNQQGLCSLVIEGPADEVIVAQLCQLVPMKPAILRGQDLSTVAGVMAQAQVYIGHDSGTTHLAALIGVPTIVLFGPTDPKQWAPRGAHVVILRGAPCECRIGEEVRHCEEKPCLEISITDILAALRGVISNGVKSTTPRNPSQYTLSQQTPCAKVPI